MKHTRETVLTVLTALRAAPASDFTVLERTRSAFGDNYGALAAYEQWRANQGGPTAERRIGGCCYASHAQLDAMAAALNRAEAPTETPRPSVDEPLPVWTPGRVLKTLKSADELNGELEHTFRRAFGEATWRKAYVAWRRAEPSGEVHQFESGHYFHESELAAVASELNRTAVAEPDPNAAPVDPYEAFAIWRLDNAGRPCGPSASLAEAVDRARQRLEDTKSALAAAERNVMTDRLEIAELETAIAEHGRKGGGA